VLLTCAALLLAGPRRTEAAGAGWRLVGLAGSAIRTIAVDPHTPATLYAAVGGTILESHDAGRSWEETGYSGQARLLLIDPATPATLYALDDQGAVTKSIDSAASWTDASNGLPGPVIGFGLDAIEPTTLWAADYSFVFRSTNGAAAWHQFFRPPHGVTAFAVSPTRSGVHLGLYRDGTGFVGEDAPGGDHSLARRVVVAAGARAERAAGSYCPIAAAQSPIYSVTADPARPDIVYAGYASGVCKTNDGGASWRFLSEGIGTRIDFIDPFHPDTLYVFSDPLSRSTDGGETWRPFDEGFAPGVVVTALTVDGEGRLYAATTDGLYALDPDETTPTPTPTATPTTCVGDCDGNGEVAVGELVAMVSIALGDADAASCPGGDRNGNGAADIDEVLAAVDGALNGCAGSEPSPTPTPEPESEMGACYESSNCFPCDVYPCRPFAAERAYCCQLAVTIQGATFSWCPAEAFDPSSNSCAQCASPCE
jgi:photosystem II stability/assembly factor-like uncharacterized protein